MVAPLAMLALKAGVSGAGALARRKKAAPARGLKRIRRRRTRLTASMLRELTMIKSILGRTAAANALPFYMGK